MKNIYKASLSDSIEINKIDQIVFGNDAYSDQITKQCIFMNDMSFVYTIDHKIIGFILCEKECYDGYIYTFSICSFGVLPEHQNKGIGTKLINECINYMKDSVFYEPIKIILEVRKTNDIALSLYKKIGFIQTEIIEKYYSDGEDGIQMELDIKS